MTTNLKTQPAIALEDNGANLSRHKKLMLLFILIAVLGAAFAIWMFWNHVYAYEGHVKDGLSKYPVDWGTFGTYISGVLNPFFSLLAFFALLWTVKIPPAKPEACKCEPLKAG